MSAHLSFHYVVARHGFSLDVAAAVAGDVVGLFGPSGAGKSTLLHCIAGILKPDSGHLTLAGDTLEDTAAGVYCPAWQRRCGMIFQNSRLFPHKSVAGNLRFGMTHRPQGVPTRFCFDELVAILELEPLLEKRPHQLSGGEAQRVALGRALLANPLLLLLDEPMTGLDRGRKRQILPFLRMLKRDHQVPMIYVSHDLSEMLQLTDHLMVVDRGRLVGQGRFPDLVRRLDILNLFHDLGLMNVIPLRTTSHQHAEGTSRFLPENAPPQSAEWVGSLHGGQPDQVIYTLLRPEDIALVREPVANISIRNQIQGVIEDIVVNGNKALCILQVGVLLLAEITPDAIHGMDLKKGQTLWCMFKAQALTYLD